MQKEYSNFAVDGEQRAIPESAPASFRAKIEAARDRKTAIVPQADADPEGWSLLKNFLRQ